MLIFSFILLSPQPKLPSSQQTAECTCSTRAMLETTGVSKLKAIKQMLYSFNAHLLAYAEATVKSVPSVLVSNNIHLGWTALKSVVRFVIFIAIRCTERDCRLR